MPPKTRVGVDTPQMEAFLELGRANDALGRILDRELQAQRGITLTEYLLLLTLRYSPAGQLPLGDLAGEVPLTKSGVTRLVDRMEVAGFVERSPCATDRRIIYAVITASGRAELRKAWPVHRRGIDAHFARNLSDADAVVLRDLLRRIPAQPEA